MKASVDEARSRLEELRTELREERISQGELLELQSLVEFIDPYDVELLEPAGVPEAAIGCTPVPGAELRYDDDGEPIVEVATCGTCGRSWNDAAVSSVTPTPSGRCPFEYDHEDESDEDVTRTVEAFGVTVIITRSAGSDKAPVVFVDTSEDLDADDGPAIRIRLNDEPVYVGVAYELEDEDETRCGNCGGSGVRCCEFGRDS